jgi:hypothetical protein
MLFGVAWLLATACARYHRVKQMCVEKKQSGFSGDNPDGKALKFVSCMSLEGVREYPA